LVEPALPRERVDDPRLRPRADRSARLAAHERQRARGPLAARVVVDDHRLAGGAPAVAVEDERLRRLRVPGVDEHALDGVLDVPDARDATRMAALEVERDDAGQLLREE